MITKSSVKIPCKFNSLYFLLLLSTVNLCIAGIFKCPPSDTIHPCKCFTWDEKVATSVLSDETNESNLTNTEVEISCRTVETTDETLAHLFNQLNQYIVTNEYINTFTSLRLENTGIRNLLNHSFFGEISFVNIDLFFNQQLQSIDLSIFGKSNETLETLLIQGSPMNVTIFSEINQYPHLTTVILANNHLSDLPVDAFARIPQTELSYLDLTYNNLTRLTNQTFYQLTSLQRISLDHNAITTIDSQAFDFVNANESQLLLIFLRHNNLTSDSFVADSFVSTERTIFLYLNNNRITHLPEPVFKPILAQKNDLFVALWSNPFECDCRSKWLLSDISYYKKRLHGIRCRDKRELWDLTVADLTAAGNC